MQLFGIYIHLRDKDKKQNTHITILLHIFYTTKNLVDIIGFIIHIIKYLDVFFCT